MLPYIFPYILPCNLVFVDITFALLDIPRFDQNLLNFDYLVQLWDEIRFNYVSVL